MTHPTKVRYAKSAAGQAAQKRYRARHPERVRAAGARWRAKNPDYQLRKVYGITREQWDRMFDAQGRCCAICGSADPGSVKGWHTDHCHERNVVRGILCYNCNTGLGKLGDSLPKLRAAVAYLERTCPDFDLLFTATSPNPLD